MYKYFIKNEQDSLQREVFIDALLGIYDQRINFFPGQEGMILGMKGSELYRNRRSDMSSVKDAYDILKESFNLDTDELDDTDDFNLDDLLDNIQ